MEEGFPLHIVASLTAGLVATTVCAPFDLIKTRIMCDPHHLLYKNPIDCAIKTVQYDGPLALFRGINIKYTLISFII